MDRGNAAVQEHPGQFSDMRIIVHNQYFAHRSR
jgi:hypothetical protein